MDNIFLLAQLKKPSISRIVPEPLYCSLNEMSKAVANSTDMAQAIRLVSGDHGTVN